MCIVLIVSDSKSRNFQTLQAMSLFTDVGTLISLFARVNSVYFKCILSPVGWEIIKCPLCVSVLKKVIQQ